MLFELFRPFLRCLLWLNDHGKLQYNLEWKNKYVCDRIELEGNLRRPHQQLPRQNGLLLQQVHTLQPQQGKQVRSRPLRSQIYYHIEKAFSKRTTSFGYGNKYDFTKEYLHNHSACPKVPRPTPTSSPLPSIPRAKLLRAFALGRDAIR